MPDEHDPKPGEAAEPKQQSGEGGGPRAEVSADLTVLSPEVERAVTQFVEAAPPGVRDVLISRLVRTRFVGPLPPPDMIEAYNKAVPGMGQALLDGFLEEGRHRRQMDERGLQVIVDDAEAIRQDRRRGMRYGLAVAILGFCITGASILTGHDVAGTIVGGADLVALVAVFVVGSKQSAAEQSDQSKRGGGPPERKPGT